MNNYLEEGDKVEGDWLVRNPEKMQEVCEKARVYASKTKSREASIYYNGVAEALRWALCATERVPLPQAGDVWR